MPLDPATVEADRALSALASRVDVLLDVTPVNPDEAWADSLRWGHQRELALRYRDVGTDVAAVRAALAEVPLAGVEHPAVRALLAELADHLERQLGLIEARGTPAFLDHSLALWGTADDDLVALATDLLQRVPPGPAPGSLVTPEQFAALAEAEVDRYRLQDPGLDASVEVRADVPSLMVVQRRLLVGADSWIPAHRAEALLQHEVGVHLLTAATGRRQPLTVLEHGLAGFEETQEALGVLAEHLVGGLDADRVRTLAARVVAVRCLTDGASFPELHQVLHRHHGFDERAAWTIAMRVVRGGGLTKDVIYLRGVAALVDHLAAGGDLGTLLLGKLHLGHVPALEQLVAEGTLRPAHLQPRWLTTEALAEVRAGRTPVRDWPSVVVGRDRP